MTFFFRDHPNFREYNAFSGVVYVGFPSFFTPTPMFKHFQEPNGACILAIKQLLISVHVITI